MEKNQQNKDFLNRIINDREKHVYFAYSLLRDWNSAEDAVSDSVIRLLKKWNSLEKPNFPSINGYYYKILRSVCISKLRKISLRQSKFRHILEADIKTLENSLLPDNITEANEIKEKLLETKSKVDSKSYNYFICNRVKGLTYKEIAKLYNISEGKVMRGIKKVLDNLKIALNDYITPVIIIACLIIQSLKHHWF